MQEGRLERSNNRDERSIKPFVWGQKNFLFANTPNGAKPGAIIYGLTPTAKENGLDPYRALTWLMKAAPVLDLKDSAQIATLRPENTLEMCGTGRK
ncbi:MAG: transposase [Clostridia bacterium]